MVFDPVALVLISEAAVLGRVRLIAGGMAGGMAGGADLDEDGPSRAGVPQPGDDAGAIFVEVARAKADRARLNVTGRRSYGYRILTAETTHPGRAIALILLAIRDATGVAPHVEFAWPQHGQARELLRFAFLGTGNEAAVTREILRRTEPDPLRWPKVRIADGAASVAPGVRLTWPEHYSAAGHVDHRLTS